MKPMSKAVLVSVLAGILMPYLLLNGAAIILERPTGEEPAGPTSHEDEPTAQQDIRIRVLMERETVDMDLETYLLGVVLGEMPASFEPEALKAQAVVARTYTLRRKTVGKKHTDADICTDPACCQAYGDPANYEEAVIEKVRSAVTDTRGLVLTYGGALIEATYFSSSGGRTEDAVAVWGSDLPYLQAVDSPEAAFEDQYLSEAVFTEASFENALGIDLSGSCDTWFGPVSYTNGGGVDTMEIGGREFDGTELRRLLGLRSTAFDVEIHGDQIILTTRGYGHRVGMSQYGAEAMAVDGAIFSEILAHYYQGTVLEEYIDTTAEFG